MMIDSANPATATKLDVPALVAPIRRRMALALFLRWGLRGAAAALAVAWLLALVTRLVPWPEADPLGGYTRWMAFAALAAVAAIAVAVARQWPRLEQAVRRADGALGLKDRLTTAHEFRERDGQIVRMQRSELMALLPSIDLRKAVRLRVPGREAAAVAALLLLAVGTALVPAARNSALEQKQHQRAIAQHAAQKAASVARTYHQQARTAANLAQNRYAQQGEAILRQLQAQLAQAKNQAQALKALAQAQQSLQRLGSNGEQAQKSLQALAKALASGPTSGLASALASGNGARTQQALNKLQQSLGKMSASQRAALAQKLEQAANNAPGPLSDQLRQAAFNLQDNNIPAAQQSLQAAQQQVSNAQQSASAGKLAQQAQQQLQGAKQDVANGATQDQPQANGSTAQPGSQTTSGQPGTRGATGKGSQGRLGQSSQGGGRNGQANSRGGTQGAGAGKGPGQTQGAAPGQGTGQQAGNGRVAGQGQGQGQGAVAVAGAGNGTGGSGGRGRGGGAGGAGGRDTGKYETVYLPGQRNGGPSVTQQGPLGRAVPVQSSAFHQLLPQYSTAADSSLGRTALPPSLQEAVKRYFQALGQ